MCLGRASRFGPAHSAKTALKFKYELYLTHMYTIQCNVCFIKIRSTLSSVLLLCLLRIFMKQTLEFDVQISFFQSEKSLNLTFKVCSLLAP